jgi:hypothetical protein
MADLWDNII